MAAHTVDLQPSDSEPDFEDPDDCNLSPGPVTPPTAALTSDGDTLESKKESHSQAVDAGANSSPHSTEPAMVELKQRLMKMTGTPAETVMPKGYHSSVAEFLELLADQPTSIVVEAVSQEGLEADATDAETFTGKLMAK